jgi:hypothetical protein
MLQAVSKALMQVTLTTSIRTRYHSCVYIFSQLLIIALVWKKLPLEGAVFILIKALNEYASFMITIAANLELKV